jgi:hypothetical protein
MQHPSGRFQVEQAVQATDLESESADAIHGVQLVHGIDPRRSRRLARRQKVLHDQLHSTREKL